MHFDQKTNHEMNKKIKKMRNDEKFEKS